MSCRIQSQGVRAASCRGLRFRLRRRNLHSCGPSILFRQFAAENPTRIGAMLCYESSPWCPPLSRTRALADTDFARFPIADGLLPKDHGADFLGEGGDSTN